MLERAILRPRPAWKVLLEAANQPVVDGWMHGRHKALSPLIGQVNSRLQVHVDDLCGPADLAGQLEAGLGITEPVDGRFVQLVEVCLADRPELGVKEDLVIGELVEKPVDCFLRLDRGSGAKCRESCPLRCSRLVASLYSGTSRAALFDDDQGTVARRAISSVCGPRPRATQR